MQIFEMLVMLMSNIDCKSEEFEITPSFAPETLVCSRDSPALLVLPCVGDAKR